MIAVTFLDNSQNGGESDRRVVCLDDPRFVPFHADSGIITDPGFHSVGVWDGGMYREDTGRCETGVESDKYCFDGRPSLVIDIRNCESVEAVGYAILLPFDYSTRVRHEGGGIKNSLRYEIFEESILDGMVSFTFRFPRLGFMTTAGGSIP